MTLRRRKVGLHEWPRITRFYGITPDEIRRMPNAVLAMYAEQIEELTAEETLLAMLVSDMPHMEQNDRKRVRRRFARIAGIEESAPAVDTRSATGQAVLAGLGIGAPQPSKVEDED